ncbi:hypothetical protein, partial [Klebsiella pneumoniae]|uniref:hypothetical protein n=1 Tax=Klebsiella pneumoniae TaxID=573 RepID=UPI0019535AD6
MPADEATGRFDPLAAVGLSCIDRHPTRLRQQPEPTSGPGASRRINGRPGMTDGAVLLDAVNFEVGRHDLRLSRITTE